MLNISGKISKIQLLLGTVQNKIAAFVWSGIQCKHLLLKLHKMGLAGAQTLPEHLPGLQTFGGSCFQWPARAGIPHLHPSSQQDQQGWFDVRLFGAFRPGVKANNVGNEKPGPGKLHQDRVMQQRQEGTRPPTHTWVGHWALPLDCFWMRP